MTELRSLTYVEIDIPICSLSYGVAPCTAALGVTGEIKCFNSVATCQDRANFAESEVTLRFAVATDYLPDDIDAIPIIDSVSLSPAIISLGEDLGQRASLTVNFKDIRWSDTGPGFDPYVTERGYDPFKQGTFWGKFRARQPYLRGRNIRVIRGLLGQALENMEARHYIIESFNGPTPDGVYSLIAKDVLKLADGDRAQAPALSNGFLSAGITNSATSATLSPTGIGNAEYPASGYVAIGGKEICAFTRSGDTLTLTRAQLGTAAQAHAAQDRVQLVLRYSGESPADIIYDLLVTYAGVPAGYIDLVAWQTEAAAFNARLYTATIAEPTSVNKLVSELIEQAGLAVWWDDAAQRIRLQVLRQIPTNAERFADENVIEERLSLEEQPEKRLSQVWTYYGQINPLEGQEDPNNYRSTAVTVDLDAEQDYGSPAIRKIFSRWIPEGGRSVATRINDILLRRFRNVPRRFTFAVFRHGAESPTLGEGCVLDAWPLQDATGAREDVPIQIVRLNPDETEYEIQAEEMRFPGEDEDPSVRNIIFDSNTLNVNLRTTHDQLFPEPVGGETVNCYIEEGAIVGSTSTSLPAFVVGDWPEDVTINVYVRGRIQGPGGKGGRGARATSDVNGQPGLPGGTALYTRYPINLILDEGLARIWSGGGGGGGSGSRNPDDHGGGGGGGGAGQIAGEGGPLGSSNAHAGKPGTLDAGGQGGLAYTSTSFFAGPSHSNGFRGGTGGDPGQPGATGDFNSDLKPGAGGAAGKAIDGVSFCSKTGSGDIRGSQTA